MSIEEFMSYTCQTLHRELQKPKSENRDDMIRIWIERLVICYGRLGESRG